jgi:hypothetical protein
MKVAKFCFVFLLAFALAWILIFTFTQDPFRATAPIKIFWYETPEFPMYVFAAFASAVTLIFGFSAAAYYYIAGRAGIRAKNKEIKRLEEVVKGLAEEPERLKSLIRDMEGELERLRAEQDKSREKKATSSHKAVGEKDMFL